MMNGLGWRISVTHAQAPACHTILQIFVILIMSGESDRISHVTNASAFQSLQLIIHLRGFNLVILFVILLYCRVESAKFITHIRWSHDFIYAFKPASMELYDMLHRRVRYWKSSHMEI